MKSTKIALYILMNISCLLSLQGQSKLINKDILSKKEIEYLYNRLVDELLHNQYIGVFELSEFYNKYDGDRIIVEINIITYNSILDLQKNKINKNNFLKIPTKSNLKKMRFINSVPIKKIRSKSLEKLLYSGVISIFFSDLYVDEVCNIFIGFEKVEYVPEAYSRDVTTFISGVLKAKKCPNGHLIVQEIEVQSGLTYTLNTDKCDK
jgi:hypothetical protein